ncbi:MAG TPA: hypothetical protein VGN37_04890 [Actinocatenispora sp.]
MLSGPERKRRREITRLTRDLHRGKSIYAQTTAMERLRDLGEIGAIRDWLVSAQRSEYRKAYFELTARILARVDDPAAGEALTLALRNTESYKVAQRLSEVGGEQAIEALAVWAVAHRFGPLALTMIEGIGRIGGRRAADTLVGLFATPPRDVSDRARWELKILAMLGDAGDASAIPTLVAWTAPAHSVMARTLAVDSIGRIGGPVAAEALRRMRDDESVRGAIAAVSMRSIDPDRSIAVRAKGWLPDKP